MNLEQKAITTPLVELKSKLFDSHRVKVSIKLDYMNHPEVQGNKWHKLKLNLLKAIDDNKKTILTFGGAYSNHIAATASATQSLGLGSIGVIRGDELAKNKTRWSSTLQQAEQNQMKLIFIDRQEYKKRNQPEYLRQLQKQYPEASIIPEGGSNALAIQGFQELMAEINEQQPTWTHLYTAVGTGGTLAGLYCFANEGLNNDTNRHINKTIYGVAALKQGEYLVPQIESWITACSLKQTVNNSTNWQLLTEYHDGGYAKQSTEGKNFQLNFEQEFEIPLDPIYTNKAFFAFFDQLKSGKIPPGSEIILLHTGGLQGRH